jgi:hypothetical protein
LNLKRNTDQDGNTIRFEPGYITRLILNYSWRWLLIWFVSAMAVTLAGFPGGLCLTPLIWIASVAVGIPVARAARADNYPHPVCAAAKAGAVVGTGIGIISTLAAYLTILLPGVDDVQGPIIFIFIGIAGTLICTGLSALAAWLISKQ